MFYWTYFVTRMAPSASVPASPHQKIAPNVWFNCTLLIDLNRIACRRLRTLKLRQVYDLTVAVYLLNILFIARMACPHRWRRLSTRRLRQMYD